MRNADIRRTTKETDIQVMLNLDGSGISDIHSGIPFMDHMLTLFAKHGNFDLNVHACGDLDVDCHHTMEDLGITLGHAIDHALGDKVSIRRYGNFLLPMDEALVLVALDLSGRPYLVYDLKPQSAYIKDLDTALFKEFFFALTVKSGMTLHFRQMSEPGETHHLFEAAFKGFAKALSVAVSIDPNGHGIPSTKGVL